MFRVTTLVVIFAIPHVLAVPSFHITRDVTNTSKAGLAWPNGNNGNLEQFRTTGKVSWYYTWTPFSVNTDLEFVPMLWGQTQLEQFTSTINDTIAKRGVKVVLGMNEPEQRGQSNLTPEQGAQMWKTYLEPLRSQGIRLGSPAPSSASSGKAWLKSFLTACAGACTVDFIALHYYGVDATLFEQHLADYHNTFQRPIWVTEWACQDFSGSPTRCSQDDVVLFLNTTQTFMDNSNFVERYAWFGLVNGMSGTDALMDSAGNINALGKQYIGS